MQFSLLGNFLLYWISITSKREAFLWLTSGAFAVRVQVGEDWCRSVLGTQKARPYKALSFGGPDNFHFAVHGHIVFQLPLRMSCKKKENRSDCLRCVKAYEALYIGSLLYLTNIIGYFLPARLSQ